VVVLAFGLQVYVSYRKYHDTGSINTLGLLVVNIVFLAIYIARRDASSISTSPSLWLLAFAAVCVPFIFRTTAVAAPSAAVGYSVQVVGLGALLAALLSLRRSFGIVPAHRGIRTQGLYNLVRHPVYASELLVLGGFTIANPSELNIGLWLVECVLQFARACAEERFLSADPVYLQYRARVKYRLIPLVI
jgi:protein-S-isoprenylcysteine O-methyltransferase Ste14